MRAVILNGSKISDQGLEQIQNIIVDELESRAWKVVPFLMHRLEIADCLGCFGCWVQTPGVCVIDDAGRELAKEVLNSDLVVLLSPVTFGGYSSETKKGLDRLLGLNSPFFMRIDGEVHHRPRYERYPRLMGVGTLPAADRESEMIFTSLVERNAVNMHAPAHTARVILNGRDKTEVKEVLAAAFDEMEVER